MILVCGGLADRVTELVCARLAERGYPYRLLDMGTYPEGFRVRWRWRGEHPDGDLAGPGWRHDLGEFTGIYARYLGVEGRLRPPGLDGDQAPAVFAEHDTGLAALLEHLPCAVVNRLAGGMSNHSKAYQAQIIQDCGLATPPTLVTSDPDEARRFVDEHDGAAIYKSLSGVRSIVRRVGPEHLDRLPMLRDGPAQFQALIPGDDVRVHTVGDRLFPTRVRSEAVDYRYARRDGHDVEMEPDELPADVADACRRLARRLDLLLSGVDLMRTPDGRYVCFEINPSPGFLYFEQGTGQPISAALADLLRAGPPREEAPAP